MTQEVLLYDVVHDYIISENFASDTEGANKVMLKLSDELMEEIYERTMTASEKRKDTMLKKKYDDSDMKKNMQGQYGKEEGKKVYFATIRKQAMKKEEVEVEEEVGITTHSMMMKDNAKKEAMLRKKEQEAVSKKMKKEEILTLQDANGNDFVEIIDVISAKKVQSDWRNELDEGAAWTKKSGKNKEGGLNEKGRKSYERDNPGSDLKAPSKKVGNPRRASFCARMKGMKKKLTSAKTASDPDSRINKSLRKWNC